ncbi:MAG: hypothetical protein M3P27_03765 [Acidobacteriota bacterium]|nr:hypothetical protein [Acidobacteriota bacterium]
MDYLTSKFIAFLRKLDKVLNALRSDLGEIKNHVETIAKNSEAAKQSQQAAPVLRAELQIPDTAKVQEYPQDTKKIRREWFVAGTHAATFIAIVAYAVLTFNMWNEMIRSTDAAERAVDEVRHNRLQSEKGLQVTINQFRLDQRAWVGFSGAHVDELNPDKEIIVKVDVKNSGRTLAKEFRGSSLMTFDAKSVLTHFPPPPSGGPESNAVIWPGLEVSVFVDQSVGSLVDSKQHRFKLTQPAIDRINQRQWFLFVYGTYTYRDVFGGAHFSTLCGRYSPSSKQFEACQNHNDAD